MWQELREELHPAGLEVVTVALDTGGADAARPFIEAASPTHPSLIDEYHVLDERLGVVNVPNGVWIDESGVLVRPVEPAFTRRSPLEDAPVPEGLPDRLREMLVEAKKIRTQPEAYVEALRDWVSRGAESPYALPPDEVVRRSAPRPPEVAKAAACFELGAHLWRTGQQDAAVKWWREAHRLQPDNWTYKRQAWTLLDPDQGPTEEYEGDWLSDVQRIGFENYYPPLKM